MARLLLFVLLLIFLVDAQLLGNLDYGFYNTSAKENHQLRLGFSVVTEPVLSTGLFFNQSLRSPFSNLNLVFDSDALVYYRHYMGGASLSLYGIRELEKQSMYFVFSPVLSYIFSTNSFFNSIRLLYDRKLKSVSFTLSFLAGNR